jgi:RNA polymerase sigma-70 factor (ECF subfamily)
LHAEGEGGDLVALTPAERAFGQQAAGLQVVVRAVLAAELGLRAAEATLDDLTQEVMRRALDGRHRLKAGAPVRPWLLGIARHVAADERRRARRAPEGPAEVPDPGRGPDDLLAGAQQTERLRRALGRLPEPHRRALLLFHMEELSYQEIATRLRAPMATIATWISRARAQLLGLLKEEGKP